MRNTMKLRSGAVIREVTRKEADAKNYLTRNVLTQMHLMPSGDPCAYEQNEDGSIIYYFDPARVVEAPPELWYYPTAKTDPITLESGTVIERMSIKRAATYGYYTKERLFQMHYEVIEEPVAYTIRNDKSYMYFYDKKTAVRLPLSCVKCGKDIRYKRKLCKACYEEEMEVRRAEGDAHRNASYGYSRQRVLFFDLELTGVYDHDEIISISITNALGEVIMDTLVKPVRNKKWRRTEKIHGITPEMVQDSPTLEELTPRIKEIFAACDNLIAYGVSTAISSTFTIRRQSAKRCMIRPVAVQTSLSDTFTSTAPTWYTLLWWMPWRPWALPGTVFRTPRLQIPLHARRSGMRCSPIITKANERERLLYPSDRSTIHA